jgi:PAS domain S-box-containing protein
MPTTTAHHVATCSALTRAIASSHTIDEIYHAALDALNTGLYVERAAILLFDEDGVMRFKAWRGLSDAYRHAVEGHSPWRPDSPGPQPFWIVDVLGDPALAPYAPALRSENIRAVGFVPLVSRDRVIGKFMMYYAHPTQADPDDQHLASVVASQVALAVERARLEAQAHRSKENLRFALDTASMGTWDWDLATNAIRWSDNLDRIHGLPPGSFDGTFAGYEREIHPDDRERVIASIRGAISEGVPHDVEYRIVAPDGTIRWCEGKGRVECDADGRPVRMTGVCVIVTRRKEAELARLAAAEESSRLKDEFLATLSHELRTPLNAILGWVQMMETGTLAPARSRQAIDVIGRNARLQTQLIEDILDVSRIITGKLEVERVPLSVEKLLETVLAGIAPAAEARGVALAPDIAPMLPPIEGDPKRLQQVLNNVLTNAMKFTPRGGTIVLDCRVDGESLIIQVRDSGIGIAREFLPYVFDRFRQGDSRSTRAHGGLGLGLAIARHLIEQHDGLIRAESDGPGTGTTISIVLPVTRVGPDSLAEARTTALADVRLDAIRVLVVEDQLDSREMLAAVLERQGATVTQAESAESAFAFLEAESVDLIVADIAMPGVDGYELMRRLRAARNRTPAIAVTAFARPDDRRLALECGYNGYLAKPINTSTVARAVLDLLAGGTPV